MVPQPQLRCSSNNRQRRQMLNHLQIMFHYARSKALGLRWDTVKLLFSWRVATGLESSCPTTRAESDPWCAGIMGSWGLWLTGSLETSQRRGAFQLQTLCRSPEPFFLLLDWFLSLEICTQNSLLKSAAKKHCTPSALCYVLTTNTASFPSKMHIRGYLCWRNHWIFFHASN